MSCSTIASGVLLLIVLVSAGCIADSGEPSDAPDLGSESEALTIPSGVPYIGFGGYYGSHSVALTFDDGPENFGITESIVDTLNRKGVKATFFVNSYNYCDLLREYDCRRALAKIVNWGHTVGNHTAHHYDLNETWVNVDYEFRRVEYVVHQVVPSAPTITLTRAPYGNPFKLGPQWRLDQIAKTVVRHGVHIGWSINSGDSYCSTSYCVQRNVLDQIDAGRRGIILMHATKRTTANAIGPIIDGIRARGLTIRSVESFVRSKYGQSSYSLMMAAR